MADFAITADVEAAWRPLTDIEATVAESNLAFASAIIRSNVPTIDARIAAQPAPSVLAQLAKSITVAAVVRRLQNPDGFRSVQQSIDDFSETKTRDSGVASGALFITADELRLLKGRRRAFSTKPGNEPVTCAIGEQVLVNRGRWDVV